MPPMSCHLILLLTVLVGLSSRGFATPSPIGSVTITGAEQWSSGVWDTGTVTVTMNGYPASIAYGQYSTTASVASGLAVAISQNCNFPVYAQASGAVINLYARGSVNSVTYSSASSNPSLFPTPSFEIDGTGGGSIPTISLSSSSGPPGTPIAISGTNFGTSQGSSTVSFSGTVVAVSSWSASLIVVVVPSTFAIGLYDVSVTVSGVSSIDDPFTVVPQITSLALVSESGSTGLTIAGLGFGASQGSSTVTIGTTAATVVSGTWLSNSVTVLVPTGVTSGNVVVTVSGYGSNGVPFTVATPISCTN
jgi:hypothetical protein